MNNKHYGFDLKLFAPVVSEVSYNMSSHCCVYLQWQQLIKNLVFVCYIGIISIDTLSGALV